MKILIADDNMQIIEYIKAILATIGLQINIIEARNGEEAVELARIHSPNLIIMDIEMPVMDGMKATRILKSESPTSGIPVIACTGSSPAEDKGLFFKNGFDGFIAKPFKIREFMNEVQNFVHA